MGVVSLIDVLILKMAPMYGTSCHVMSNLYCTRRSAPLVNLTIAILYSCIQSLTLFINKNTVF